jgi:hypothetical protein
MTAEERVALINSLSPHERSALLAYIAGYRPEAFDEAAQAWQGARK